MNNQNLSQYLNNDVERLGFLLLFLAHWSDGKFSMVEYSEYASILLEMIIVGKVDINNDGVVDKKDLEITLDNITSAMAASSYSAVVDTVKKVCSHFLPLDISAKETIMGCCIHIVRADQAVTEKEKININLIKDELGL
tara:strand:+ start:253 stop:669 length:417 start_codon:yes stop_codon:yes gene_type:complete